MSLRQALALGLSVKEHATAALYCKAADDADAAFVGPLIRKSPRYDACVGSNDQNADRFMQTSAGLGCTVPDDLRFAGFDDAGFASLLTMPLTTNRQPGRYLGITCIDAILGRLQHPELPARTLLLRGELVVRASTGAK